jgi:hypothetical protein
MYKINKVANRIEKIKEKTFSELGFLERNHLQEWLANTPDAFGEKLLIIQKEFAGFEGTNERLDLLAIDREGNLVIIENKRDDSGKDVTWQSLKYASYCSTLTKEQIRQIYQDYLDKQGEGSKAEEKMIAFFGDNDFAKISLNREQTQRIIMVAREFRPEVTSTVLWLMNYKLRIQCFKVIPYQDGDLLFLDIDQILPVQGTEEYVIKMADKMQEDKKMQEDINSGALLRFEFWKQFLKEINLQSSIFQNVNPSKEPYICYGSGISGIVFLFSIRNKSVTVGVYLERTEKEENKTIFNLLYNQKETIEKVFGKPLIWEKKPDIKSSQIIFRHDNFDYQNRENWDEMIKLMVDEMIKLENAFRVPINEIKIK